MISTGRTMPNAFTIDLEDYFHVSAFDDILDRADWDRQESRVEASTRRLLDLLDRFEVKATFFVLGWVADRKPDLVREVAERGHEIGAHSFEHRLVYSLSREAFEADLQRCLDAVEAACGVRPRSYRAPSFSVREDSLWALESMAAHGIEIDSSIFPVRHDRYGIPSYPRFPLQTHGLVEFPMTTWRVAGVNVPCCGGGYLRIFPEWVLHRGIRQANDAGQPAVLYLHPWEVDPDQPRMPVGRLTRWRHYTGLDRVMGRLERLLERYQWSTISEALRSAPVAPAEAP
ncbi:MAG: XrtA system polysaccharide deacetylase [Planctomycetota bacterium]